MPLENNCPECGGHPNSGGTILHGPNCSEANPRLGQVVPAPGIPKPGDDSFEVSRLFRETVLSSKRAPPHLTADSIEKFELGVLEVLVRQEFRLTLAIKLAGSPEGLPAETSEQEVDQELRESIRQVLQSFRPLTWDESLEELLFHRCHEYEGTST